MAETVELNKAGTEKTIPGGWGQGTIKSAVPELPQEVKDSFKRRYGRKPGEDREPAVPSAISEREKVPGNIDLSNRPVIKNKDGTISTVRSITIEEDKKFVLIPTVRVGLERVMSNGEAIAWYKKTREHLGKFDTRAQADAYAVTLHNEQEKRYANRQGGNDGGSSTKAGNSPSEKGIGGNASEQGGATVENETSP